MFLLVYNSQLPAAMGSGTGLEPVDSSNPELGAAYLFIIIIGIQMFYFIIFEVNPYPVIKNDALVCHIVYTPANQGILCGLC
jgi:hypothetical protein